MLDTYEQARRKKGGEAEAGCQKLRPSEKVHTCKEAGRGLRCYYGGRLRNFGKFQNGDTFDSGEMSQILCWTHERGERWCLVPKK